MHAGDLLTITSRWYIGDRIPTASIARLKDNTQSSASYPQLAESSGKGGQALDGAGAQVSTTAATVRAQANRRRHITPSNQLVGGVFLHHLRKSHDSVSCASYFPGKFSHACLHSQAAGRATRGATDTPIHSGHSEAYSLAYS